MPGWGMPVQISRDSRALLRNWTAAAREGAEVSLSRLAGYRTVKVPAMPSRAWLGTGHRYW